MDKSGEAKKSTSLVGPTPDEMLEKEWREKEVKECSVEDRCMFGRN